MITVGSSQRPASTALLLRRLSTGHDLARPRVALDSRLVDQSAPHNAGYACRDRSTCFATPSTASQTAGQRTRATHRAPKSP
jgi:hypothetical protein